jgi:hypothetical protein
MLKLAKHAVALVVVTAAASAPVAAQAESISFNYTRAVVTNAVQNTDGATHDQRP